jgi:hypothetical protein
MLVSSAPGDTIPYWYLPREIIITMFLWHPLMSLTVLLFLAETTISRTISERGSRSWSTYYYIHGSTYSMYSMYVRAGDESSWSSLRPLDSVCARGVIPVFLCLPTTSKAGDFDDGAPAAPRVSPPPRTTCTNS